MLYDIPGLKLRCPGLIFLMAETLICCCVCYRVGTTMFGRGIAVGGSLLGETGSDRRGNGADGRNILRNLLVLAAASGFVLFFAMKAITPRLRPRPVPPTAPPAAPAVPRVVKKHRPGFDARLIPCSKVPETISDWVYNSLREEGWHRIILTDTSTMYLVKANLVRPTRTERFSREGATIYVETRPFTSRNPECWSARAMRQSFVWVIDGREVWREGPVNAVAIAFVPAPEDRRRWLIPLRTEVAATPETLYVAILKAAGVPGVLGAERDPTGVIRVNLDSKTALAFAGSSESEALFVARIVNTLLASTGSRGVQLLLDGTIWPALGHVDISRPLWFNTAVVKPMR